MVNLKGLKFSKMHGIGNDFPIIDESKGEVIPEADKPEACRMLCHRNFGVGGDGVLFVEPSEVADIGYRMFNPDGSEAEMFRSLYRRKLLSPEEYKIIRLRLRDRLVGEVLNRESVPSDAETENVPHMAEFGNAFRRRAPRGLKIVPASEDASSLGDTVNAEALALLEKAHGKTDSKLFKKHKISSIVYTPPAFDPAEETPSGGKLEETCR